ncbi:MAG: 4-alpha-glucanotransferase [Rhodothermales bacterium]|nr:4-alpha-glucanotransferase [Rhodothermales bacterium]
MNLPRSSGVLMHVTSLPSPFGIGDFGPQAYRFADWLAAAGQRVWQVLPLVPVGYGDSPYSSPSTFAGNPLLISPEGLRDDGLLDDADLDARPDFPEAAVDFEAVRAFKYGLLTRAFERFEAQAPEDARRAFDAFRQEHAAWLGDYALFMALREHHGEAAWTDWPAPLVRRDPDALAAARREHAEAARRHAFWQYLFDHQWSALHAYCAERGLRILGDLPIYVAHDSADTWGNPELFFLDDHGRPSVVAGVPPDYFSETGQRWGNPIYRWSVMRERDFRWWTQRLRRALALFDVVRLDHFRGFAAYWEIPAEEETAVHGRWVEAPGEAFFEHLRQTLGGLPLLAEDLGTIDDAVRGLMRRFGLPGMAVLQFAFGGDVTSDYLPHNFRRRLVAYTGTHDNDTFAGWWARETGTQEAEAAARERAFARRYLALGDDDAVHWAAIRALAASVADVAIVPVQDVLGLGSEARMNTPGSDRENWAWRLRPGQLTDAHGERLRALTRLYGRAEDPEPPV